MNNNSNTTVQPSKKLAAQFSKAAKVKALTTLLRNAYGGSFSRKDLKEFEQKNNIVVQWVARREDPVQNFRTPLGFVRSGRGTFAIPVDSNPIAGVAARTADAVKTVTEVPGGPGRDVVDSIQGYADRERGVTGVNAQVERGFRD